MNKPSGDASRTEAIDRWVRTTLEVPPDADAAACRRAFLEGLERDDFVPLPAWEEALDLLNGSDARALAFEASHEESLRGEVAEFADGFFELEIGERRERWERLRKACWPFPPLRARLDRLERGLDVDVGGLDMCLDPVRQLGEYVCRLFVLHGREKTEFARDGFAYRLTGPDFMHTAGALKLTRPDIEALEPEFVRRLTRGGTTVVKRPDTRGRTRYVRQSVPTPTEQSSGGFPWWVLLFLGGPVFGLIAGLADKDSANNRNWNPSSPRFQPSEKDLRALQGIFAEANLRSERRERGLDDGPVMMLGRTKDGRAIQRFRTESGDLVDSVDGRPIGPVDKLVVGERYIRSTGEPAIQYTDETGTTHDVLMTEDLAKTSPGGYEVVGVASPLGPWRQPESGKAVATDAVPWKPGIYEGRTRDGRVVRRQINGSFKLDSVDRSPIRDEDRLVLGQVVDRPGGPMLVFEDPEGHAAQTPYSTAPNVVYLRSDGAEIVPLKPVSEQPDGTNDELLERALERIQGESP